MAIKHKFASGKADGGDATLVRPSNWNDDHNHVPFAYYFLTEGSTSQALTNAAAALTEFAAAPKVRNQIDLTYASEVRLVASQTVAGVAGFELRAQYSTDGGTNWNYGDGAAGPAAGAGTGGNVIRVGSWVTLAAGAKGDFLWRLVYINGDGVADPAFWWVAMQVR